MLSQTHTAMADAVEEGIDKYTRTGSDVANKLACRRHAPEHGYAVADP